MGKVRSSKEEETTMVHRHFDPFYKSFSVALFVIAILSFFVCPLFAERKFIPPPSLTEYLVKDIVTKDKTLTALAGWWWFPSMTQYQIDDFTKKNNARVIEIAIAYNEPGKVQNFAVVMVKNEGLYEEKEAKTLYNMDSQDFYTYCKKNKFRVTAMDSYLYAWSWSNSDFKDKPRPFYVAAVVPEESTSYSINTRIAEPDMGKWIDEQQDRFIDIASFVEGSVRYYNASAVRNKGEHKKPWYLLVDRTAESIAEDLKNYRARLIDVEPLGKNKFTVIAMFEDDLDVNRFVDIYKLSKEYYDNNYISPISHANIPSFAVLDRDPDTKNRTWWYYGVDANQISHFIKLHNARIVDLDPFPYFNNTQTLYSVLLVDNGIAKTGKEVPQLMAFDRSITHLMKQWDIPGAALSVLDGKKLVYARGFGHKSLEKDTLVSIGDNFRLAQVSRILTRDAVTRLINKGFLSPQDKVFVKYLKNLTGKVKTKNISKINDITLQHLMDEKVEWNLSYTKPHDFSFAMLHKEWQYTAFINKTGNWADLEKMSKELITEMLYMYPLSFAPGEKKAKSENKDFIYCILGRVIEAASSMPYYEYVWKMIDERESNKKNIGAISFGLGSSEPPPDLVADKVVWYYDHPLSSSISHPYYDINSWDNNSLSYNKSMPYGMVNVRGMDSAAGWEGSVINLARYFHYAPPEKKDYYGLFPGTAAFVQKYKQYVFILLLNSSPEHDKYDSFRDDVYWALTEVSEKVKSWPTEDLFKSHFQD